MDWFTTPSRPPKSLEFYQQKVLSFLFSAEGRDDFRCLNVPIAQLGFYSPLHFISCIPLELCEPFKNDRLFLASFGELRRGDKVLLLEKGTEGIIRSAVFKGRRLGKSSEPEILLDGHRKSYSEEEVVPYKAHLRQHLGTSLVPEKDYDIRDGVLQWEDPSWEPGQEVYYKPEKRWVTILSHETNQRGRPVVIAKMDGTNVKKEKTARILLQDLQENGVPVRIPKRKVQEELTLTSDSSSVSLPSTPIESTPPPMVPTEENEREVIEIIHTPPTLVSSASPQYATVNKRSESAPGNERQHNKDNLSSPKVVTYEEYNGSPVAPARRFKVKSDSRDSPGPPPLPTSPPPSKQSQQRYDTSAKPTENKENSFLKPALRKKSTKRETRPATEYYSGQPSQPQSEQTSNIYHEPETLKFKSCNNLDTAVSDDDLEPFELVNYTNSLRSSARKIIQKQLAQDSQNRAASLKLRPTTTRPHVAEIFTWDNDKMKMTKRIEPVGMHQPIYTKPATATTTTVGAHSNSSCNNLSKSQSRSQPEMHKNSDQVDSKSYSRPQSSMQHPFYQTQQAKPNPLDFNFAPLSSSELVKKQLAVVNRVLVDHQPAYNQVFSQKYNSSLSPSIKQRFNEGTGVSSDSSSPDNDSGRGSIQYIPDTINSSSNNNNIKPILKESSAQMTAQSKMSSPMTNAENNVNSMNRRYTKNRSTSRSSSLPRHMSLKEDKDVVEEETYNIPIPFNPGNLAAVSGFGKGIQGTTNSSYADSTLCALFTCSNIFDMVLLFSKPGLVERGIKREVRKILRDKIVTPLRMDAYCKSESVTHLREAMLPLSSKMHSPLMDAQEFLYLLFDSALNTESFIEFSNGTKDFMHQIIARPKDRSKSQTVQFMLETSLNTSGLKFKQMPSPALFLCMPRCKGRLVYYEAIIPSLQLNVTRLLHKGPKQCVCEMAATLECIVCHQKNGDMALDFCDVCKGIADQIHFRLDHSPHLVPKSQRDEVLNLHSIICTRGNRYVAFVKVAEHRLSPWLFFDSQVGEHPEVTLLEDFGRWLDSLEKQPGHFREFAKLHPLLKRIMTDSHIYIYSRAHLTAIPDQTESLVI